MGRTRRSGNTAGEALPLQFHIAGLQKGVGSFSAAVVPSRLAQATAAGHPCQQPRAQACSALRGLQAPAASPSARQRVGRGRCIGY